MDDRGTTTITRTYIVRSAALALALVLAFALAGMITCGKAFAITAGTPAQATHGTLSISADAAAGSTITLAVGETATVKVSPYQHVQYKGCTKPECPNGCAELVEDCFTVGKGCMCNGPAPELRGGART